jgi:hypothetical protein
VLHQDLSGIGEMLPDQILRGFLLLIAVLYKVSDPHSVFQIAKLQLLEHI